MQIGIIYRNTLALTLVAVAAGSGAVTPVSEVSGWSQVGTPPAVPEPDALPTELLGPVFGDVTDRGARVWGRLDLAGRDESLVRWWVQRGDNVVLQGDLEPTDATDGTFVLDVNGLVPSTRYTVRLSATRDDMPQGEAAAPADWSVSGAFTTSAPSGTAVTARLAFGSCASHDRFASQPIWTAIQDRRPELLVLLGDTPYIDNPELEHLRTRYAEFWAIPELRKLTSEVPVLATWDDHDYATNDRFGNQPGRDQSRRAFIEFHPQRRYGNGSAGIYSHARHGPVDLFLLDTRWFGDEEPLVEGGEARSLLGAEQRQWLIDGIERSTARVKVLACGMVWNDAVRPGKRDHWGTWAAEREAIFAALRDSKNPSAAKGIVLVGGDIHRPRVLRHVASKTSLGYAPTELISTPLANHAIATAEQPHDGLVWDASADSIAMTLDVDTAAATPRVTATFFGPTGAVLHTHELRAADLGWQ